MHGLMNRAIQGFVCDTYGRSLWLEVARGCELGFSEFESMLIYEDGLTWCLLDAIALRNHKSVDDLLEDMGTYLVSHPNTESLRRLLRFGGVDFVEFLHSLDDLPGRARLAVSDLDLPELELREHAAHRFSLTCISPHRGFGQVLMGVLRAMADDYGALVLLEHRGVSRGSDIIEITLVETRFAEGRIFDLGAGAAL